MKWECPQCNCKSDFIQNNCPNDCEIESEIDAMREFHQSVQEFCAVFQDDYDYCQLCLTKEFTKMKKCFWKVKEDILEASCVILNE